MPILSFVPVGAGAVDRTIGAVRAIGAAFLLAVLAVAGGCGGHAQEASGPGLSKAELRWVGKYATWSDGFYRELGREAEARANVLGDPAGVERYRAATEELRNCESGLDTLGETSSRLTPTRNAVRRMCRSIAAAATRLADANGEGTVDAFVDMNTAGSGVYLEAQRIDGALDELTLARGKLARIGGASNASRVDPTLTAVAARVADGRSIQVRCWSPADWKRVLDEESALTLGAMTVDTVGAFAQPLTGTVHMQQEQCTPLVSLARDGLVPYDDHGDLYDLAFAVGTLSHEIQHIVAPGANEAGTECAGVQHNADVAMELGVLADEAREIAAFYWERIYPEEGDAYRTADCRPGGVLDLAPETDAWPTG